MSCPNGSSPATSVIDLTGTTALVTGASSGLGRRFAEVLAASGASVVAAARRVDRLEELVSQIEDNGGKAAAVALDVTDPASITASLEACEQTVGLPNLLVNNAGVPDGRRAHKVPPSVVDLVLNTNLRGPWLLACEFARRCLEVGTEGRIINISSMAAFHYGGEAAALYAVTKAAVNRMTEVLAVEWAANGINVNAIAPGAFESEMMDGMLARAGDIFPAFPRKRLGVPSQLDSTLLYLASPASAAVTGTVIKVDDGQNHR